MQKAHYEVANHIKELGLAMLAHSLRHSLQECFVSSDLTSYMDCLGVLQAAQACEILIKARIAQEDPLRIFIKPPESNHENLNIESLAKAGNTVKYSDLPKILRKTTGYEIKDKKKFKDFGELRNTIQHFAVPESRNLTQETIEFIFCVIEPLINEFWGLYATHFYVENPLDTLGIFPPNYDYEPHNDIFNILLKSNVSFLVSEKYKDQVEKDRKNLELIVMAANFITGLPEKSLCIGDEVMIKQIKEKFNLSFCDAESLQSEALHVLHKNTPYKKWRIKPLY
ncbi:MAG: hypothetical protein ISR72_11175 [Methylobacter sp.]|nr:hypothetical protein [Methylobacter sp.]